MQSPSDFSLKCHPMMSLPVSEDGRCLVGPEAMNVLRSVRASKS
jgi:hypothetical protein